MASTDAKPIPVKGAAYRVTFPIFDSTGALVTGAAGLDSEISKDGGAFADCTNEATGIATSSGMYYLDLTSTEMNADTVAVIVKTSTTNAKTTPIVIYPKESGDISVTVETGGIAAASFAAGAIDASAIADNAIDAAAIATGAITAAKFAAGAIDAAAIATGAIDADSIAADAITAAKIANGAIDAATFASGAIDASAIGTGAIDADAFAAGAINAAAIADGAIDAATFATDAISATAFAQGAADKVWSTTSRTVTGFAAAAIQSIWDNLLSATYAVGSIGAKFKALLATLGTDERPTISTDAQDLSATLSVNAKLLNGATPNNLSAAQVNTEVDTALSDIDLDHLTKVGSAPTPTIGSIIDKIMNKDGSQTFTQGTDSLEALADSAVTPPTEDEIVDNLLTSTVDVTLPDGSVVAVEIGAALSAITSALSPKMKEYVAP